MKKLMSIVMALCLALTMLSAVAVAEDTTWAYGALPLNSEGYGVATIYYTSAYYELEGIVNPVSADYSPYTEEEISAIRDSAVEGAEGYRFDAPAGALIGMSVYGNEDVVYWYDAENAAAITGHADPLHMDTATGVFYTTDELATAAPISQETWAYGALPLNSEGYGVATIYYTSAYYELEGIVNPVSADYSPYTEEEIASIRDGAVEGAEGYRFDAPASALIGMSVYGNEEVVYWYDAKNAAAITGHADPLHMDTATGIFYTADDVETAAPISK